MNNSSTDIPLMRKSQNIRSVKDMRLNNLISFDELGYLNSESIPLSSYWL